MKREKNQKVYSGRKRKISEKKVDLFFTKCEGKGFFVSPFEFFSSTPFGAIFNRPKMINLKFRFLNFFYIYIETAKKNVSKFNN
jgi:hypothetical protein